jgi:bifunctional NMN adenylyltransferase/nudix hydrolase
MEDNTTDIGVLIGRFQVHELHEAHKALINHVISNHRKVIIFLGVSAIVGTKRNPLDFATRKSMLDQTYGEKINAILPIHDNRSDENWSKEIDKRIKEVFHIGNVTLYGSRDSFIPHYKGVHKTHELESKTFVSGTTNRKLVSQSILSTPEFRAGVIYGVYNNYPVVYSTVDVAIINDEGEVLLARKPSDPAGLHRFVGGFVDITDKDDYAACRREAFEETNCIVEPMQYICSIQVDDWRYRKEEERKIMTRLFVAKYISGRIEPRDDISELQWFKLSDIKSDLIVPEHRPLMDKFIWTLNLK